MSTPHTFNLGPGWRILFQDMGIRAETVLERAGLPEHVLDIGQDGLRLTTPQYFAFWDALGEVLGDHTFPLKMAKAFSMEVFDPPIFAAVCSPDLNTALKRIALYKRLTCPMKLHVRVESKLTTLEIEWLDKLHTPPATLVIAELVFFVQLARMATRALIRPVNLISPVLPEDQTPFREYFGMNIRRGERHLIEFTAQDASRAFMTNKSNMWQFFEPELQRQLNALEQNATVAERVQNTLMELLPAGESSMQSIARKLAMSGRTLQRRLKSEGTTYQNVLNDTRGKLAHHYLRTSTLSGAEISYLLGFEDPNSFFRAFRAWTGQTPEKVRLTLQTA